jgi:hypothetical protein
VKDFESHKRSAESIVKRMKKSELAEHIAKLTHAHQQERDRLLAALEEARKATPDTLDEVRAALGLTDEEPLISTAETWAEEREKMRDLLDLDTTDDLVDSVRCCRDERDGLYNAIGEHLGEYPQDVDEVEHILKEKGEHLANLDAALTCALTDREALLARHRLTDREWSAMGGYSYMDMKA